jgi:hypothetical protein
MGDDDRWRLIHPKGVGRPQPYNGKGKEIISRLFSVAAPSYSCSSRRLESHLAHCPRNPNGFTQEASKSQDRKAQTQEADERKPPQEAFALQVIGGNFRG